MCFSHLPVERAPVGHHLDKTHPDREKLGAKPRARGLDLLGGVVICSGPDVHPQTGILDSDHQAEVGEDTLPVLRHEDVFRLDIPLEVSCGEDPADGVQDTVEHPEGGKAR